MIRDQGCVLKSGQAIPRFTRVDRVNSSEIGLQWVRKS